MSDAAQPSAAEVRAAAEAVKAALDRHLDAVERRSGEDDPAVYAAFNDLAATAEAYDELLYDAYDEVTPFEIPGDDTLPAYAGPEEPSALSLLIRRDYAVVEPQRLLAQAQRVADLDPDVDTPPGPAGAAAVGNVGGSVHAALGVIFGEYEPDEIASRHKEFGLEEGDSTLWVTASDDPAEPGEWLSAPFEQADPQRVICRFDVSAVFDEDLDGDDDSDDDDADEDDGDDGIDGIDDDVMDEDAADGAPGSRGDGGGPPSPTKH
ncbi:hypothetical protein [Streptomyces hiroshimensis]|uniref:Uncharacterized protein n=1 Tax=Streptomyces hiroshimensis TaxID=66424 RepID=A0ABQ2YZ13_9ACTN|nr:hypothetical protein [Streptomyces hiroshimensis]GGY00042.1 hypothetical protein GCM10010324_53240 [Streptomyces hiroshimensis]